ncbi:MAG: HEAT repeat domain-containing protein [Bryobacteraceae bacterium]|nr:HEAT repeat domain-containing protein [Bryobacteraceae bacterium]
MRSDNSGMAKGAERPMMADIVDEFVQQSTVDAKSELEFDLLKDLVRGFSTNPLLARRAMRELLSRAPARFYSASLQVLKASEPTPGHDYLISLLLENDLLSIALADPDAFTTKTAITLARNLSRMDPYLDAKLIRKMFREDGTCAADADPAAGHRILEIIDAVSDGTRLVPALMKLAKHKDKRIQSKATLLLARAHHNPEWFAAQMTNQDPRVRANAIEGLLKTGATRKQVEAVWQAAKDPHHRVVTTALLVLLRAGEAQAAERLQQLAENSTEPFRLAAAWAMGESGDARFLETLQRMAKTEAGNVRRMAIKGAVSLRKQAGADGGV